MSFIQSECCCSQTPLSERGEEREFYRAAWESLSEDGEREERADGNGTGMTRTEKKSLVLWLERQSEKKRREGGSRRKTGVYESQLY